MIDMEVGTVIVKIVGREAGKVGVVLKKVDDKFVSITGPRLLTGVKRRKCNITHLQPTNYKIEIKQDATDDEVLEAFKKSGLTNKLNLKFPSASEVKKYSYKPKEEVVPAKKEKPAKTKKAPKVKE